MAQTIEDKIEICEQRIRHQQYLNRKAEKLLGKGIRRDSDLRHEIEAGEWYIRDIEREIKALRKGK